MSTEPNEGQRMTIGGRAGRYARAWREGFTRGARDALRVAQRETHDPHMWMVLSRIAERYDDGDPDGYPLRDG